jgi:ribosomal protein L7/L12
LIISLLYFSPLCGAGGGNNGLTAIHTFSTNQSCTHNALGLRVKYSLQSKKMQTNHYNSSLYLFQIEQIENDLREGKIDKAILFYQEIAGNTLAEAKEIIDNWILPEDEGFSETNIQERAYLYFSEKGTLYAIKFVKDIKKMSLKGAIEYVDDLLSKKKQP